MVDGSSVLRLSYGTSSFSKLADCNGVPVIPITSPADRAELESVAALHRMETVTVRASEVTGSMPPLPAVRAGTVVAMGAEVIEIASLYAHLTQRGPAMIVDRDDDWPELRIAVVVVLASRLTQSLLARINETSRAQEYAVGLIVGADLEMLSLVARKFAAALACDKGSRSPMVVLLPDEEFDIVDKPNVRLLGGLSPTAKFDRELAGGAATLMLLTHSRGFDFNVGTVFFCPFPPDWPRMTLGVPACVTTGWCTAFPGTLERTEAWSARRLRSLRGIRAHHFLLITCGALRVAENPLFAPEFGLAVSVLAQSTIGTCFTTSRTEHAERDGREFYSLMSELSAGQSAGAALAHFRNRQSFEATTSELHLLGDPDYAVLPQLNGTATIEHDLDFSTVLVDPQSVRRQAAFLVLMKNVTQHLSDNAVSRPFSETEVLQSDLDRLLSRVSQGQSGQSLRRLWDSVNSQLARLVAHGPWVSYYLDAFGSLSLESERGRCECCGANATASTLRIYATEVELRFVRCHSCDGLTESAPRECKPAVSFRDLGEGVISLARPIIGGSIYISLITENFTDCEVTQPELAGRIMPWPLLEDGRHAETFRLPPDMPLPPVRCAVSCVDALGLSISSASVPWDLHARQQRSQLGCPV